MADYTKGKIYKILSDNTDKIYIGSTINELQHRFKDHQRGFKKWKEDNEKGYCSSYEILKYNDARIELLEQYPCAEKYELISKENYHMNKNNLLCVNIRRGHSCPEELHEIEMRKAKILREKRTLKKKQENEQWLKSLNCKTL